VSFYVSTATFILLHCDEWDRVVALPRHKFVTGATLLQLLHYVWWHPVITLASKRAFRVLLLELAHKLQVEVGRYQGTLPQNRVCHRCNTGEIDDEIHYLFKCVKFTQERAKVNDQITLICQNINNLDDNNRLLWIE
jgi:hypothetical protein